MTSDGLPMADQNAQVRGSGQPWQQHCGDYGHRNRAGLLCGAVVISGHTACKHHAGMSLAKVRARVETRRAVLAWDVCQPTVDPGEALLRLLTVTFQRARMLADLLQRAYEAAEALAQAEAAAALMAELDCQADEDEGRGPPAVDAARSMLAQVLATGGVAALVGRTRAGDGSGGTVETGEQIRALAALEQSERKLAADLAAKAVAAGIAERQVRLAERAADLMVAIVAGTLRELGQDADDARVSAVVEGQIVRVLAAGG